MSILDTVKNALDAVANATSGISGSTDASGRTTLSIQNPTIQVSADEIFKVGGPYILGVIVLLAVIALILLNR